MADELPELVSTLRLRRRLDALPRLDASARSLDDRHLLRASSVITLLSQVYNNVPLRPPDAPEQLAEPWLQISERLDKPRWTFTTVDFICHNWRFVDPQAQDPMRAENLELRHRRLGPPADDELHARLDGAPRGLDAARRLRRARGGGLPASR